MTSMRYDESPDQAAEYLRLTFNMMGENKITPNPLNITLCYEYISNSNPELNKAMDEVLSGPDGYTDGAGYLLFQQFIWDDDKRNLDTLRGQLASLIGSTHYNISEAEAAVLLSAKKFEQHSKRFSPTSSIDDIQVILADVVKETKQVAENGHTLKQMLDETKNEVELLREELEKTKREATTDPLTGLKNRRAFENSIQEKIQHVKEKDNNLCLVMVDIDHFKQVNDKYGHVFGDKVLKSVASVLMENLKGKDMIARIGGEEFAIMLPETKLKFAEIVAENLRYAVQVSRIKKSDTGEILDKVTVSMGIAVYHMGESIEQFIDRADKALYESKNTGRNKITAYH